LFILKITAKTGDGRGTPGALRRSRKSGDFSSQLEVPSAQSAGYTGDFPQRGHILAVCGAKFAIIRL
jgi:hypothetical protein